MLKNPISRSIVLFFVVVTSLVVYWQSGLAQMTDIERVRQVAASPWASIIIIISMAGAWAFALPASVFFFIVPIFYTPPTATLILIAASVLGAAAGYLVARWLGGPWIERVQEHRVTSFLSRNSNWANLFAVRVVPSSPHGIINYGAGLLRVPMARFLSATAAAIAVKGMLYANAISAATTATSLRDALDTTTMLTLFGIGCLAVVGQLVAKRLGAGTGSG